MVKRIIVMALLASLSVTTGGCLALVAAGSAGGTAAWLSGKLTQEVDASVEEVFAASKKALTSLNLTITGQTLKDDVSQVMGLDVDQQTIWVDAHKISEMRSRIEVRVGAISDKETARKILDRILRYL